MLKKELELELNRTKVLLDYARNELKEKDKEIEKLNNTIDKAIEKYEKCKEEDYCTLALDMYDILRGKDE